MHVWCLTACIKHPSESSDSLYRTALLTYLLVIRQQVEALIQACKLQQEDLQNISNNLPQRLPSGLGLPLAAARDGAQHGGAGAGPAATAEPAARAQAAPGAVKSSAAGG